jgi:hypothetical protein
LPAVPELGGVIAGLAIIASAAGVFAQQTEQLSLPKVSVTAPAAPVAAPCQTDDAKHGCDGKANDGLTCYKVIYLIDKYCLL